MDGMRPARWWPRYQAELAASGGAGIRDLETDVLYRTGSLGDAHVDADYLTAQWRAGNDAEVARHLAFVTEQATKGRAPHSAAPPAPEPQRVLGAATAWDSARRESDAAQADHERTRALSAVRRSCETAESEMNLAVAAVVDAIRELYADPLPAQQVISDTSEAVPLPALANLIRSEPTVFGSLAEPSVRRYGPEAARLEVTNRTERLAAAIESQATAALALDTAFSAAAAALRIDPAATSRDDLARTLDEQSRSRTTEHTRDPNHVLARRTDHLRSLLAAADEKTRATVVNRFPASATIAREARSHSPSLAPDL
jgi:hypothetical protein